jgi:hypothetical protein
MSKEKRLPLWRERELLWAKCCASLQPITKLLFSADMLPAKESTQLPAPQDIDDLEILFARQRFFPFFFA